MGLGHELAIQVERWSERCLAVMSAVADLSELSEEGRLLAIRIATARSQRIEYFDPSKGVYEEIGPE